MYHNKSFIYRSVTPTAFKFRLQFASGDRPHEQIKKPTTSIYKLSIFSAVALSFVLGFYIAM